MSAGRIRVLLVDDHAVLLAGLRALLGAHGHVEVVGEAENAEEAVRRLETSTPDIVVMDLGMPGGSPFEAIRAIRAIRPSTRVVVLSMYKGREFVTRAIEAGADGYVPKSAAHVHLLRAIETVAAGERYLDPRATAALVEAVRSSQEAGVLLDILSTREAEVLRMTALGHTSREIGERLGLSPKTVDTYRRRVMIKLGLESRSDLVRVAMQARLLEDRSLPG